MTEPRPMRMVDLETRVPFGSYMYPELQKRLKLACVEDGIEIQQALEDAVFGWLVAREQRQEG